MKKLFFSVFATGLFLAACSNQNDFDYNLDPNVEQSSTSKVEIRSESDALRLAGMIKGGSMESRSHANLKTHVILGQQSRSGAADTLLYAVDFENDGGFVLIGAPKNSEPIIAIIDEGSFDDPVNLTNEPYQAVLSQIKANIQDKITFPINPDPFDPDTTKLPLIPLWYRDTIDIKRFKDPIIEVAWNQSWPENIFAPNQCAGCVPVAIAQLLSIFEKPQNITYTFPERDIASETLNWTELKKHKRSSHSAYGSECTANNATHYSLARFVRQLGQQANADYSKPLSTSVVTGAYIEDIIYGYTSKRPDYKFNNLKNLFNELSWDGGAAIVDFRLSTDPKNGHAFIAEGAELVEYTVTRYDYTSEFGYVPTTEQHTLIQNIHYNWGWGGNCNGWFSINAVNPSNSVSYDYPDEDNYSFSDYDINSMLSWYYKIN